MPVTQGSAQITNLAVKLAEQLQSGGAPARTTFGAKDGAFAWTTGLPRGLWNFVGTATVEGSGLSAIHVAPTATPPAVVAPGAAKPNAVTLTAAVHPLAKYAGMATFKFEQAAYSDILAQAVTHTLVALSMSALEADCVGALAAGSGSTITGDASWPAAVLSGIAEVAGAGGSPGVLVISPSDFAAAVESPSQLQFRGDEAIPTFLGLDLHLSPAATPGTAYVLDPSAVIVGESSQSPSVVADPYTLASTNEIRIVTDLMAVPVVTSGGLVVELVPTFVP